MTKTNTHWEVIVEENENGDLVLPIPQDLLNSQGWKEGDDLEFTDNKDGSWTIHKIKKDQSDPGTTG
jgi:bifunctional DNA-binding transcriptional regulator/antitoxin component of YhaV-PrlF toxin-antitoxin module